MKSHLLVATLAACRGGATPAEPVRPAEPQPPWAADLAARCDRHDYKPAGTAADYHAPTIDGFTIAAPQACERDTAYIRIERITGSRRFGTGRGPSGGFSEGCMTAPVDRTQCEVINIMVPGREVSDALMKRGFPSGGPGLGPCGNSNGDYAAWNMSISVLSWAQADVAVKLAAEALDRYDIAGVIGVGVEGATCVALE